MNHEYLYTDFYRAAHRNKLLAEAFYLTGEVEKYGTGFIRIRKHFSGNYAGMNLRLDSGSGIFCIDVGLQEAIEETAPQTTRDQIVLLLKENPQLTKQDLMNRLQKASGTIKEHMRKKNRGQKNRGHKKIGVKYHIDCLCIYVYCSLHAKTAPYRI